MSIVRVCISLNKKNLKLLDDSKGMATRSAYLAFLIEKELSYNGVQN